MHIDKEKELDISFLRECFLYAPETGELSWKHRPESHFKTRQAFINFNRDNAGNTVGSINNRNYLTTRLKGSVQIVHRLVWAIHYGNYPEGYVDHINGNRSDNRISNLRVVDNEQNTRNAKKYANNSSGQTGVHRRKDNGKYFAFISDGKKKVNLGQYHTYDEAVAARKLAEIKYGYHENHGR
ncbi:MAG: HNH endonuclease [Citrobacter sp.]